MSFEHVEQQCTECGVELSIIPFNTAGDIIVCDNELCNQYRQKKGFHKNPRTPEELADAYKEMGKDEKHRKHGVTILDPMGEDEELEEILHETGND